MTKTLKDWRSEARLLMKVAKLNGHTIKEQQHEIKRLKRLLTKQGFTAYSSS